MCIRINNRVWFLPQAWFTVGKESIPFLMPRVKTKPLKSNRKKTQHQLVSGQIWYQTFISSHPKKWGFPHFLSPENPGSGNSHRKHNLALPLRFFPSFKVENFELQRCSFDHCAMDFAATGTFLALNRKHSLFEQKKPWKKRLSLKGN